MDTGGKARGRAPASLLWLQSEPEAADTEARATIRSPGSAVEGTAGRQAGAPGSERKARGLSALSAPSTLSALRALSTLNALSALRALSILSALRILSTLNALSTPSTLSAPSAPRPSARGDGAQRSRRRASGRQQPGAAS